MNNKINNNFKISKMTKVCLKRSKQKDILIIDMERIFYYIIQWPAITNAVS